MPSHWEDNPEFWPALEKLYAQAVEDKAETIAEKAQDRARTSGGHQVGSVRSEGAERDEDGVYARVQIEKGLGLIYEPGAPNRQLKGSGRYRAGTNRGSIDALHFLETAAEEEMESGLDIDRYL